MGRLKSALADRYAIEQELGAGGMATVYLAEDLKHHRKVAIKVLRPELAAALGPERFLREIEIAANLNHPHILPLYDSGERDGFLFYVMPYVEGESLRHLLAREGALSVRDAVRILRELGDALAYAHAQGVIHRDIKPDNVMLSGRHAVVMDFGVAKAVSEATGSRDLTTAGVAIGTPSYMAPEQAAADPNIDHRVDVYAFGVVAYELLTGEPPFVGPPHVVLAAHVTRAPEPIADRRAGLPPELAQLVMECLEKDPSRRAQAFGQIVTKLENVITPSGGSPPTGAVRKAATPQQERSIAVLPFKNLSTDPESEYFADGMTEEIINALSQVDALHVASRTSAFAFKGKEQDIRVIGEQLNVRAVLEGSVRQAGNRIRVTAQLVNASDGYDLWSERYDRDLEDIFAVQDEIASSIAEALTAKLTSASSIRVKRATDLEAYKLYLKGRFQWNKRTNEAMHAAVRLFQDALERDPSYAPAYAGIADCFALLGWVAFGALPPNEAFPRAESAVRKALELDETLAEAHNTLAWIKLVYGWHWEEAEREFQRAVELNPRYAMAHSWYGLHLAWTGRTDEAIEASNRAMELEPLSLIIHTLAGWVSYFAERYDDSIGLYEKAIELDPRYVRAHLGLGWAYEQLGQLDLAIEHFEMGESISEGSARYVAALGHAAAIAGDHTRATQQLERLSELAESGFVSPSYFASVYAGLEKIDDTFDWLEKSYHNRSGSLVYLHVDPQFKEVRSDPRYEALRTRVGLTANH